MLQAKIQVVKNEARGAKQLNALSELEELLMRGQVAEAWQRQCGLCAWGIDNPPEPRSKTATAVDIHLTGIGFLYK
jgi:hypothetical protein